MSQVSIINHFERDWKRVYAEFAWNQDEGRWQRALPNANLDRVFSIAGVAFNQFGKSQAGAFWELMISGFRLLDASLPGPWRIDPRERLSAGGEQSGFYWLSAAGKVVTEVRFKAAATKEAIMVLSTARLGWGESTLIFVIGSKQQSIRRDAG